jgi:hypothetical protein
LANPAVLVVKGLGHRFKTTGQVFRAHLVRLTPLLSDRYSRVKDLKFLRYIAALRGYPFRWLSTSCDVVD